MVEALKKLDKKFLIIAGCIILLPLLLIIFLAIVQSCGNSKVTYEQYEDKMISAAEKYLKKEKKLPTGEAEVVTTSLDTLVDGGYIKSPSKLLEDETCSGQVNVRRNGSSVESNNGGFLNYTVSLTCDDYKTKHFIDVLTENIVTSGSGLYKVGDEYIFKGDKVKNYITLFDVEYRIMSITNDGMLKLIKSEQEYNTRVWDNKYNTETNSSSGKTIYEDSSLLNHLISDYENSKVISKKLKPYIVAYDTCTGKRASDDYTISRDIDCSSKVGKQLISLLNVSDFALASTDPECVSTISKSCRNYNYLNKMSISTWTPNSIKDNSYEAMYISDGLSGFESADRYNEYNIVIYIDGNQLFTKGEGTELNPYVIK